VVGAVLAALCLAVPVTLSADYKAVPYSEWVANSCELVDDGWASTVGPYPWYRGGWEYPWEAVLALRQRGGAARGSITAETVIDAQPSAMHRAMWDQSWLGRYVYVESVETGIIERSLVIDAMANWTTVIDLTPDQITSLNGGEFRAGLRVRVWSCEAAPPVSG
jgi:hypothetical protein